MKYGHFLKRFPPTFWGYFIPNIGEYANITNINRYLYIPEITNVPKLLMLRCY